MKTSSLSAILLLLSPISVAGHGVVRKLVIDGKSYTGPNAGDVDAKASPIRMVATTNPNHLKNPNHPLNDHASDNQEGIDSDTPANLICGVGAKPGKLIADNAMPGSNLEFHWIDGDDQKPWPHTLGPILTYMASCGNVTCDKFDASQAKWFKIDEVGQKPGKKGSDDSSWVQNDVFLGKPATATIPSNLKAGNYLVRHEIIALHLADKKFGAEFYPSCMQIKVGGNETGEPRQEDLVTFPGAYSASDPGIFVNVFNDGFNYTKAGGPPGPKIATIISANATSSEDSLPSVIASQSASAPSVSQTASKSGTCKSKKSSSKKASNNVAAVMTTSSATSSASDSFQSDTTIILTQASPSASAISSESVDSGYRKRSLRLGRVMRNHHRQSFQAFD